jgi:hypothetical protein
MGAHATYAATVLKTDPADIFRSFIWRWLHLERGHTDLDVARLFWVIAVEHREVSHQDVLREVDIHHAVEVGEVQILH